LADAPNPFELPEDDRADAVLLGFWWYRWLAGRHPDLLEEVMRKLEVRTGVLLGLDGADQFALGFPPEALERFAAVIKFQGLYRDRDLYNYVVGPAYPGAKWTEKLRPRPARYRDADLDKLRLSVPCFMRDLPPIRRNARRRESGPVRTTGRHMSPAERVGRNLAERLLIKAFVAGVGGRPLQVHCVVGLSHVQRIEAMRLLEGFSGTRGLASTQAAMPRLIAGTEHGDVPLPSDVRSELVAAARPYRRDPVGRLPFLLDLRRHKVAVAPAGYGELTHRHGEALLCGAALVCQDLSHVEMMFPLRDRENVAFCRPDLSDLRPTVDELLRDDGLRQRIAHHGRRSFAFWSRSWREHLYNGIEAHVREAVNGGQARPGCRSPLR
jgi:hypothetical protein